MFFFLSKYVNCLMFKQTFQFGAEDLQRELTIFNLLIQW